MRRCIVTGLSCYIVVHIIIIIMTSWQRKHRRLRRPGLDISDDVPTDCNNEACENSVRVNLLRRTCAELPTRHRFPPRQTSHVAIQRSAADAGDPSRYAFILVDDVHKVLYCAIPKAASTTWKTLFALGTQHPLTSSMSEHQIESEQFMRRIGLRFLSSYGLADVAERLASYRKLVVVRHPFARVASAYADKVARVNSYGEQVRRKIIAMTSSSGDVSNTSSSLFRPISFAQFIRYLVEQHEHGMTPDHHWMTYDDLCHVCDLDYDLVVKVETMSTDAERLLPSLLGVERRHIGLPQLNAERSRTRKAATTTDNRLTLYDQVPRDVMTRLVSIYSDDMKMFGYLWNAQTLAADCGTRSQRELNETSASCCCC